MKNEVFGEKLFNIINDIKPKEPPKSKYDDMKLVSNQKQSKSSKNMKLKTMEEYSIKVNPYGDASTTEDDMQDPNEDSVKRNNGMNNKNPVIPSMYEHAPSSF